MSWSKMKERKGAEGVVPLLLLYLGKISRKVRGLTLTHGNIYVTL